MTNNKTVLSWLDEMKELLTPDEIVWIDGSAEQQELLRHRPPVRPAGRYKPADP